MSLLHRVKNLACFIAICCPIVATGDPYCADVSFVVVDCKFNYRDGVKICEVQQGGGNSYKGLEFLEGRKGVMAEKIHSFLSQFFNRYWFVTKGMSSALAKRFRSYSNWKGFHSFKKLRKDKSYKKYGRYAVSDPLRLEHYNGLLACNYRLLNHEILEKYRGVIALNAVLTAFFGEGPHTDKVAVNRFFDTSENLQRFRPQWQDYPKKYSEKLVNAILEDFPCEVLVIKPRKSCKGQGILILDRSDVDNVLRTILVHASDLNTHPDEAYRWWGMDAEPNFIVEEFVPSEPVYVPHLGGNPYDGTLRVAAILTYDKRGMNAHFLDCYWVLPEKNLLGRGSLNEKHKSCCLSEDHYSSVDPDLKRVALDQLEEALLLLYEKVVL